MNNTQPNYEHFLKEMKEAKINYDKLESIEITKEEYKQEIDKLKRFIIYCDKRIEVFVYYRGSTNNIIEISSLDIENICNNFRNMKYDINRSIDLLINKNYKIEEFIRNILEQQKNIKKYIKNSLKDEDMGGLIIDMGHKYDEFMRDKEIKFKKLEEKYGIEEQNKLAEKYSYIFEERAEGDDKDELFSEDKTNGYKEIAKGWKWLTMVFIGLGLLFVITIDIILYRCLYPSLPDEIKNSPDFIKNLPLYFGSIKFTFFTILGYAIFISNRNFSNNKHLYNIYRQKADNLKVYTAFRNTIDDPKVQNEISSYIAKTIFETVDTGFIRQVPENSPLIGNIFPKKE